ncbi:MAG: nucleotide exchange factor GrpE, partial [Lachnospiraceae bacterium]|nr:nucleotide exchange factor GrpE [Lachnospiraceae bacterium]
NAVMTDEESEAEVDTVTEELQKGYTYKNQVLRHSMVKVKK